MSALTGLFITGISIAMAIYWIVAVVEVARIPGWQFDAAGASKTAWMLTVIFLGIIGALLWLFLRRSDVLAAEDFEPDPDEALPDFYPVSEGGLRWWDGVSWTDRYDTWSGAPPRR
jgi:ABC-type nickel/cobalt efflux system permease component RcnA